MKIGLIARCEYARGLAIQSKGFYENVPVDKVLLVRMPALRLDCPERPEWYPGAQHIAYDAREHTLPENEVRSFLDGLDVVFTVETTYDWRLPDWARSMGVRTVIQGNPEFYRHDHNDGMYRSHPDAWWWPTPWRTDVLPRGRIVPVPMPDHEWTAAEVGRSPLRFLHVAGKLAHEDRNGTNIVINALRSIGEPCDFTIQGFGWQLEDDYPQQPGSPVNLTVDNVGVEDRWEMYVGQSLLVLPRRYGGLCLPALEAASRGVAVLMPGCSPNTVLAQRWLNHRTDRTVRLACGPVQMADVDFRDLALQLDVLSREPQLVFDMQRQAFAEVPRWSNYRALYLEELERLCP